MSVADQAVFDAIKRIREGETVNVTLRGVTLPVRPWRDEDPNTREGAGYNIHVLCKLRGRMRFAEVSFKDAGPNPKLWGPRVGFFVSRKFIYGVVALPFSEAQWLVDT